MYIPQLDIKILNILPRISKNILRKSDINKKKINLSHRNYAQYQYIIFNSRSSEILVNLLQRESLL